MRFTLERSNSLKTAPAEGCAFDVSADGTSKPRSLSAGTRAEALADQQNHRTRLGAYAGTQIATP
jgi:hypothetical protein